MEQKKFDEASKIQASINYHKMIRERIENKGGFFKINFGMSIREEATHFMPITQEPFTDNEFLQKLMDVTAEYCDKKISELSSEFSKI